MTLFNLSPQTLIFKFWNESWRTELLRYKKVHLFQCISCIYKEKLNLKILVPPYLTFLLNILDKILI